MARASSSKKIARVAAASGDKRARRQRNIGYSAGLAAVVIIGLLLVAFARNANQAASANDKAPRANLGDGKKSDHWHAAFAVFICGQEQPAAQDSTAPDTLGIHTHGEGTVHIHPFASRAGGSGATLGKFLDRVGIKASSSEIRMPDGKIYRQGETTCGGKAAEIQVAHWKDGPKATGKKPDRVYTTGFDNIEFSENYGAYTLAFGPKGMQIPAPSGSSKLIANGQADAGGASSAPGAGQPVPGGSNGSGSPSGGGSPLTP